MVVGFAWFVEMRDDLAPPRGTWPGSCGGVFRRAVPVTVGCGWGPPMGMGMGTLVLVDVAGRTSTFTVWFGSWSVVRSLKDWKSIISAEHAPA
jgi:hypothetical protein